MNNCDSHNDVFAKSNPTKINHEYIQNLTSDNCRKESSGNNDFEVSQIPENHRKVNHRCPHSLGPSPRPFKKARFAWEIKNYDYTMRKMTQNVPLTQPINQDNSLESHARELNHSDYKEEYPLSVNPCAGIGQICGPRILHDGKNAGMHMIGPPSHQPSLIGPIIPTSYHAHYGAIMGSNPNQTPSLPHGERLNSFHTQIPPDPDARLIRWHTRQLCRSIFDNTVNRMLENMGFSPVTERSQGLHPLLVLSLSDDEEREAEEVHQRALETQALSVALHQKGLLPPPPYHYDPLESATTSDYDSSEEDSELGEAGTDDLAIEPPQPPHSIENDSYITFNSQHPSLAHIVNRPIPYLPTHMSLHPAVVPINQAPHIESCGLNCPSAQNLCDLQNNCDASNSPTRNPPSEPRQRSSVSIIEKEEKEVPPPDSNIQDYRVDCSPECQSLKCGNESCGHDKTDICDKQLSVDANKNCIDSPKQATLVEGKVERVLDDRRSSELGFEGNASKNASENNNDSYFIRNSIQIALKQHDLGFQKA